MAVMTLGYVLAMLLFFEPRAPGFGFALLLAIGYGAGVSSVRRHSVEKPE